MQAGARIGRQLYERRQESGERLAAAGRRDQQHAFAGCCRIQHGELVRPRLPSARGKPGSEVWGESHDGEFDMVPAIAGALLPA